MTVSDEVQDRVDELNAILEKALWENPEVQAAFEKLAADIQDRTASEWRAEGRGSVYDNGVRLDLPWSELSEAAKRDNIDAAVWTMLSRLAVSHLVHLDPDHIPPLIDYIRVSLHAHHD